LHGFKLSHSLTGHTQVSLFTHPPVKIDPQKLVLWQNHGGGINVVFGAGERNLQKNQEQFQTEQE